MADVHLELIDQVKEATSAKEILEVAYRLEEDAYTLFTDQAELTDSPEAKRIFTELAKFEKGHMKQVQEMAAQYA